MRRHSSWLTPLLVGLVGLGFAFHPMLFSGFDRMQSDVGDTRHLNFVLEHAHRWLTQAPGHAPLFDPPIFFPEPNTGAYTELLLGVVPFYSPLRWLGLAPDSAFQAWMLLMGALNFAAAWAMLRHGVGTSSEASSVGAFLFAFGSARLNQLNHQHLLPHFYTALAVLCLMRAFSAQARGARRAAGRWLVGFCLGVTAQLYAAYYYGWFLGFVLLLAGLAALATPSLRRPFLDFMRAQALALAAGAALSALLLWPLGKHYLEAARAVGFRSFGDAEGMVPQLQSWLYLGGRSWLYGWMARLPTVGDMSMEWEQRLGLGLVTTAITAITLYRERSRPLVRVLGLAAVALLVVATLYRGQVTPWRLVFLYVPGASAIRAISRIGILMLIPAAVGVALFLDRPRPSRAGAVALGLLCLVEQGQGLESYDKAAKRADVAALAAHLPEGCKTFFYSPVGSARPSFETQLDAMWVALEHGPPTVNGYSSNFPPGWALDEHNLAREPDRARLEAALQAWAESRHLDRRDICWVQLPDLRG